THAVAEQEQRLAALLVLDAHAQGVQIGDELREPADVAARPFGPAVTALVERVDREPTRHQSLDEVAVTAAVLGIAVRDDHHRMDVAIGKPGLPEEPYTSLARELSLAVNHCVRTMAT